MANAKRKCLQCKGYCRVVEMRVVNGKHFCDEDCLVSYCVKAGKKLEASREKQSRADIRKRKEALRTKPQQLALTQSAVNGWCNARDRLNNRPCISCRKPLNWSAPQFGNTTGAEAGHYRSRGAAPHLRFHTGNINAQCTQCNSPRGKSGNHIDYRIGLVKRFGIEHVERIESDQRPRKYTMDELKRIAKIFRKRTRLYKRLGEQRESMAA